MAAGKLIKTVKWVLNPNEINDGTMIIDSTSFSINNDGKISKWHLRLKHMDLWKSGCFDKFDGVMQLHYNTGFIDAKKPVEMTLMVLHKTGGEKKYIAPLNVRMNIVFRLIISGKKFDYDSYFVNGKLQIVCEFRQISLTKTSNISSISEDQMFNMVTLSERETALFRTNDGHEWKISKKLASEKSPVLKKMIESAAQEDGICEVRVSYSGEVIKELLRYILFEKVNISNYIDIDLYEAAKSYQIAGLKKFCLNSMQSRLNLWNSLEILQLVITNDETDSDLYDSCCTAVLRYSPIEKFKAKLDLQSEKITGQLFKDLFAKMNDETLYEALKIDEVKETIRDKITPEDWERKIMQLPGGLNSISSTCPPHNGISYCNLQ